MTSSTPDLPLEKIYANILDATSEGLIGLDRDDCITFINAAAFKMLATNEAAKQSTQSFVGKKISEAILENARDHRRTPLVEQGEVVGSLISFAQPAALALREHILEAVFTEAPGSIVLFRGPEYIVEAANREYRSRFADREIEGQPLFEILPELKEQGVRERLDRVFATGQSYHGHEARVMLSQSHNGPLVESFYDFTYFRVHGPDGQAYGVCSHSFNVTERVMTRKRLEESSEKLSLALETGRIGFYDLDLITDQVAYSERMRLDWDIPPSEQNGSLESALSRILVEDQERVVLAINESIAKGIPFCAEYRVLRGDGKIIWIGARGKVSYDEKGRPLRFMGTSVEITDIKAAASELEEAKLSAQRASQTKSSFLANMSHEIRTPLGSILGFTELLKDDQLDAAERSQFLETISRNGKALTRIIDDILDLARVESGKLDVENVEFSFRNLLEEVLDLFRERAKIKGLHMILEMPSEIPPLILSDPARLRQIFINIIGNAVKFTPRGGINVQVRSLVRGRNRTEFTVFVKDTGVGISEEQRQSLFQPFTQADNSHTRKFGGAGLGLALSNRLASALGGGIQIQDCELDEGCTFVISFVATLPEKASVQAAASTVQSEAMSEKAGRLAGLHILVADDSLDNQVLIRRVLTKHGADVDTASNGLEAYEQAMARNYHIVLMDIQMPEMDGYTATKKLRASGFKRPIVALTAHAMAEDRVRTLAAGCNGHLTKPLNQSELLSTIEDFVRSEKA